ncbi:MAG: glycosyltransferase family 4 protein [Candidatus Thorarchaeota archaeon]
MSLNIAMLFELGPDDNGRIGGGVELHATNLSKELTRRGHKVTYITGAVPNCKNEIIIEGVKYKRIDFCSFLKKAYNPQHLNFSRQLFFLIKNRVSSLNRIIGSEEFDIFHGHIYSSGLSASHLAKKTRSAFVNTVHGSYYKYWDQITKNRLSSSIYKMMERQIVPLLVKKCKYQIHTDYDFAELVKRWIKPKMKSKITTILNGVDVKLFNPQIKKKSELVNEEGPLIITTRRLVPKNGVIYLVKSFKGVLKKFPNAKLIIIGDGPEKERIRKEIHVQKIKANTQLIGMISNDEIPSYLVAADIVVVPSIVEASSISVLEAMAMKLPIVASDIPGIREITNFGKNCVLVPSKDPQSLAEGILRLLTSKEEAQEFANSGYQEVLQNYSWEKKAKEIEQIYYKALDGK